MYHISKAIFGKRIFLNVSKPDTTHLVMEFMNLVTDGYTLAAALHILQQEDMDKTPADFPEGVSHRYQYLQGLVEKVVDLVWESPNVGEILGTVNQAQSRCECNCSNPECAYCPFGPRCHQQSRSPEFPDVFLQETSTPLETVQDTQDFCVYCRRDSGKRKTGDSPPQAKKRRKQNGAVGEIDHKREYSRAVLWHALNHTVRIDAVKENDGDRMMSHWRFDLLRLSGGNYFNTAANLVLAASGGVSPRMAHQLIWSRTINPEGGEGNNVEMDLQVESYNKEIKSMFVNYKFISTKL